LTRIEIMQMPVEKLCLETGNVLERFETAEVPEEKDNVDEMMMQFRGREEELVETLRSMQERQVAQKSRIEGQKRAKRDARAAVKNKYTDETPLAVDNTGAPADENWMNEIDNTLGADGENSSSSFGRLGIEQLEPPQEEDEDNETKEMQEKLREAIDNENWDVVAETASLPRAGTMK
jgi:hypothetical protein